MTSSAEQLPPEIWLMVFHYFEAHDLFHAFDRLNSYINSILASNYLSFFLRLKAADHNPVQSPHQSHWLDSILTRTICLRSAVQDRSNSLFEFLPLHTDKLIRLQNLSIRIDSSNSLHTSSICTALNELSTLRYLSLKCALDRYLLESILTIQTLHTCRLVLRGSIAKTNYQLNSNNKLKELDLIFINNVDQLTIHLLLSYTPTLRRLEISGSYFSFEGISFLSNPSYILPDLRILKLKLQSGQLAEHCFQDLHSIAPRLKQFYFNYQKHVLSATFVHLFISSWWPIIEQISYVDIAIEGHLITDTTDDSTQMNAQQIRQSLLDRNKQFPSSLKVKCDEHDLIAFRRINILIEKSPRAK